MKLIEQKSLFYEPIKTTTIIFVCLGFKTIKVKCIGEVVLLAD